jgi:hypothetical protein
VQDGLNREKGKRSSIVAQSHFLRPEILPDVHSRIDLSGVQGDTEVMEKHALGLRGRQNKSPSHLLDYMIFIELLS